MVIIDVDKFLLRMFTDVLGDYCGVSLDISFKDCGVDDLDIVEIIMNIEKDLNITIDDDSMYSIFLGDNNIRDIKKYLRDKHDIMGLVEGRKFKIIKIEK